MLKVKQLNAFYGRAQALNDISLEVNQGEIVTLIGANGAGKTTILACITGLLKSWNGRIDFRAQDLSKMEPEEIVKQGVTLVPEDRGLFGPMSVAENLTLGAYLRIKREKKQVEEDFERVLELFPILKIRLRQPVATLSGGQQQMVAVGRAFMAKPRILLLDEPSLGLAPLVIKEIFKVLETLNRDGVTILLVEQNANLALHTAHRGYVVENGRITIQGSSAELLNHSLIKQAYLGRHKIKETI